MMSKLMDLIGKNTNDDFLTSTLIEINIKDVNEDTGMIICKLTTD